jgi:hypothetical protein
MSTEAAIERGRGIVANPAFFLIFFISASMGIAGLGSIGISGVWGWGLAALTAITFGIAWVTGLGEKLFVAMIALLGLVSGLVTAYVVFYLWGVVHHSYLWGSVLALTMVVMPVAVVMGERVLPLIVGFMAGIWGVVSLIVFSMVVFNVGMGT